MDRVYIVIPAYNESENIEKCVNEWYPVIERHNQDGKSRLVIINDGSKDDTYQILQCLARERPMLIPITKENGGHGSAVLYGYRYAIAEGADYIFQTDSDGQTSADEFEGFWEERYNYDAILGIRTKRGDGIIREYIEKIVCILLRFIFGVKIKDANAPFRLMKATLVDKYIDNLPKDFNIPNIMFTTYFVYFREKVLFRPITFKPRQGGVNSVNIRKILKIGWKAIKDFYVFKREIDE